MKFRGARHRTGEWLFTIDPAEGLVIIPLAFLAPREHASEVRVSTGTPDLDQMCEGGVFKDAVVLLTGPTGAGKTLTGLMFARAASESGERCLFYTYDEPRDRLIRSAAGWGLDLKAIEESGLLRVAVYPEAASLGPLPQPAQEHRGVPTEPAGHRHPVGTGAHRHSPRGLLDFVIALGAVLREREITTLLTSAPSGRFTSTITPAIALESTSLADVGINIRYVEHAGNIQRHRHFANPWIRPRLRRTPNHHGGRERHADWRPTPTHRPPPPQRRRNVTRAFHCVLGVGAGPQSCCPPALLAAIGRTLSALSGMRSHSSSPTSPDVLGRWPPDPEGLVPCSLK